MPQSKLEALNDSGLTRAIGTLFSAVAQGGGAKGFREELGFSQSDEELREMGKEIRKIKGKNKKETERLRRDAFIEMTGGETSKVAQLSRDLERVQEKVGSFLFPPLHSSSRSAKNFSDIAADIRITCFRSVETSSPFHLTLPTS